MNTRTIKIKDTFLTSGGLVKSNIIQPGAKIGNYRTYIIREIKEVPVNLDISNLLFKYKHTPISPKKLSLNFNELKKTINF